MDNLEIRSSFIWTSLLIFLLVFAGMILFVNLGSRPLLSSGEARASEIASEMLYRGDFIVPHLNEEILLTKPPLFHWIIISSYKVFGISEFSARFPSAVAGVLIVLVVFLLGKSLWKEQYGLYAGLLLLLSPMFFWSARCARIDAMLLLYSTFSFYCFWQGYKKSQSSRVWFLVWFFSMGLGVLSKGPVGALSLVVGCIFLILMGEKKKIKKIPWIWGIVIFLLVVLPWYICVLLKVPQHKAVLFFLQQNKAWATGGGHGEWFKGYVYIFHLLFSFFPWSLFLPLVFISTWKEFKSKKSPEVVFLWIWFLVVFFLFFFLGKKVGRYILPLYPAAALLVAKIIMEKRSRGIFNTIVASFIAIWMVIVAIVWKFKFWVTIWPDQIDPLLVKICSKHFALYGPTVIMFGVFFILLGIYGLFRYYWIAKKEQSLYGMSLNVVLLVGILVVFVFCVIPIEREYYSPKPFCTMLRNKVMPEDKIYAFKSWDNSIRFYYGKHVDVLHDEEVLQSLLDSPQKVYCFMWEKVYRTLELQNVKQVVRGYRVMEHDVVLISN